MKNAITTIIIFYSLLHALSSQTSSITELHFPYKNGYEFNMTDTAIKYDKYSFPESQFVQETQYKVSDDPQKKGVLIFKLDVYDRNTDQLATSVNSSLTWGKKGMSWWVESDGSSKKNTKVTNAIKLPLTKGVKWNSIFNDQKAIMTCITTDTTLSTIYGAIQCFGISYDVTLADEKEYKYYAVYKEYYNVYAGKVHTEDEQYIIIKSTDKVMLMSKSWGNITYSNLSEEEKQLIK